MTTIIATKRNWRHEREVIQINKASHTGASGFARLRGQALFGGVARSGLHYVLVDLAPEHAQIDELRRKHGDIENWWYRRVGFGFECLMASEARYLCRTASSERIIANLEAADG